MSARIAIAGGGPSGLMVARLLAEDGHHVDIFEANAEIGGLCRSKTVDGYVFDLAGGHIMFTRDQRVGDFWTSLFEDEPCVTTQRNTRIYHDRDCWVNYPFENALGELPLEHNLECTEGVIRANIERAITPEPRDFEAWIRWKMGEGVAKHFMDPYNRKIWKSDLAEMGTTWIAGRVPDAPLEDVLRSSLGETTEGYTHQSVFRYPTHNGFAEIHERMAAPIRGSIHCNHRVERIEQANGGRGGWLVDGEHYDHVVSTVPLHHLPKIMPAMETGAREAAAEMKYRGVASYILGIEEEHVRPYSWVYLPHQWQGPTNRITYLSNYSPNNAPTGKGSILAEVTYAPGSEPDVSGAGQRELAQSLAGADLLDADKVAVSDGYLNGCAYILYDLDFEARRDTVLAHLDALPGFHALGRFGRYEYHNSDQCIARAMDLVERLRPDLERGGAAG